ncbi:hypothetical protein ATCV1_z028R [Acanthocystis turfacea chlorella virus 1]|uniref:Uncharacterized protein z028R n=1 Tax=Chlorovirus heliozoae TaxID=322019 RepID=A7K7Y8_9PHYC|nr:hypothetical protein ATCV1_z028R [Acanthocystis turfacea chlorella virus 1]ABT16162.1 hypothetical protein ATCV1_z028R [Acanthocystis turfacea chlorella virus 1]
MSLGRDFEHFRTVCMRCWYFEDNRPNAFAADTSDRFRIEPKDFSMLLDVKVNALQILSGRSHTSAQAAKNISFSVLEDTSPEFSSAMSSAVRPVVFFLRTSSGNSLAMFPHNVPHPTRLHSVA